MTVYAKMQRETKKNMNISLIFFTYDEMFNTEIIFSKNEVHGEHIMPKVSESYRPENTVVFSVIQCHWFLNQLSFYISSVLKLDLILMSSILKSDIILMPQ